MPGVERLLEELGVGDGNTEISQTSEGEYESSGTAIARKSLKNIRTEIEKKSGKIPVFGRYHRCPHSLADDYEVSSAVIGHGFNGSIKLATSKHLSGQRFAVKTFALIDISATERQVLLAEVMNFMCMDHPHVARLVDVYESKKYLNIVMECLEGGELFHRIEAAGHFSEEQAAKVARQILLAVNYIHSHGVVHRDIKHSNILYDSDGDDYVKLIDFGFSKLAKLEDSESKDGSILSTPSSHLTRMKTNCGTAGYMAPEIDADESYTSKCDLWSVGVVVYHLLTGDMPRMGFQSILWDDAPRWKELSQSAKDFTKALLQKEPESRLSAREALRDPWMQSVQTRRMVDPKILSALQDYSDLPRVRRCFLSMLPFSLSNLERSKVHEDFLCLDENRRGAIDLEDLRLVVKKNTSGIFKKISTKPQEICFSDFLAAVVSSHIGVHQELLHASFRRFDIDRCGTISCENLKLLLGDTFEGAPVEPLLSDIRQIAPNGISFEIFASCINGTLKVGSENVEKQRKAGCQHKCCAVQ